MLFTLMVIVTEALPPSPSLTVNVTILLLEAEKPGVQLNVLPDNEEPAGLPDTEYVSASPSRSDPESVRDRAEPSATVRLPMLPKVGSSLTGFTVIDTVAADDVAVPFDTVKVKLSEPL